MAQVSAYGDDIGRIAGLDLPWWKLEGKNVLVTGAAGLVGGSTVEALLRGAAGAAGIYAMVRDEGAFRKRFGKYRGDPRLGCLVHDVTEPLGCAIRFDFIIHAASPAVPAAFAGRPVEVMKANLLGVANLMDYGIGHGLGRFLYVSSGEVYGEGDGRTFAEDDSGYVDCTLPRSCYPSSKRAAETLCASYADEYGVEAVIARPCHVYGPHFTERDNRAYAQFIRNALAGQDIVMKGDGGQYRSWCYSADCASALLYVLLLGEAGRAYNVADAGACMSIGELARLVAELAGRKVVSARAAVDEEKGYCRVRKAVLDASRLEALGWSVEGTVREKLAATLEECRTAGGMR